MKTNYKIILYLLPIVLFFTTCRKNDSKPADQHFYYYLTKEQLAKTSYFTNPAFDTLTYVSNLNDTLVFAKTRTDTLWYTSHDMNIGSGLDTYYHYQQLRNNYATLKGEGKFEVKYCLDGFPIGLPNPVRNYLQVEFINNVFSFYLSSMGDQRYTNYLGDIKIEGVIFNDVMFEYDKNNYNSRRVALFSSNFSFFSFQDSSSQLKYLMKN